MESRKRHNNRRAGKRPRGRDLVRGNGYSFTETARLMKMQKGTVQVLLKRAEEKIYNLVADLTEQGISFKRPVQTAVFSIFFETRLINVSEESKAFKAFDMFFLLFWF